jgi:uncharacterized protein
VVRRVHGARRKIKKKTEEKHYSGGEPISLKPSRYNYFVQYADQFLLFNTHTDALALVDSDMKGVFDHFDESVAPSLSEEELAIMKSKGFLIDEKVNEIDQVQFRYNNFIINNYNSLVELTLIMTYACNLGCTYCYEKDLQVARSMDSSVIQKVKTYIEKQAIGEAFKKKINLVFYGGEPLLNWKGCQSFLTFLDECHQQSGNDYETRLVTNGTLLTDEVLHEFLNHNCVVLQLTLDGCKEDHNQRRKTRKGEGTYDTILKWISRVYDIRKEIVHIRVNVDNTNYRNLPLLFDDLAERGLTDVSLYFGIIHEFTRSCKTGDTGYFDLKNMQVTLPDLWYLAFSRGLSVKSRPTTTPVYCMFDLHHAFVIDPYADFYNCWNTVGIKDFSIGTLDEKGDFTPNSNYFEYMSRDPTHFEECRNCSMLPVCMGGCAFVGYKLHDTFHSSGCGEFKELMGERLRWYVEREYSDLKKGEHREIF